MAKCRKSLPPFPDGHLPFFLRVLQGQEDNFQGRVVVRECTLVFDDFSDLPDAGLNRVGGVDGLADQGRI
jgi:hypothetical protein